MSNNKYADFYDWLIDVVARVQSHYACPAECQSDCCKNDMVNLTRPDYKHVTKSPDRELVRLFKSKLTAPGSGEFYKTLPTTPVCPLLSDSKCRIYDRRPEACRKFPFQTACMDDSFLQLVLCPMSIAILRDYAQWMKTVDQIEHVALVDICKKHKDTTVSDKLCVPVDPLYLTRFADYLDETHRSPADF